MPAACPWPACSHSRPALRFEKRHDNVEVAEADVADAEVADAEVAEAEAADAEVANAVIAVAEALETEVAEPDASILRSASVWKRRLDKRNNINLCLVD